MSVDLPERPMPQPWPAAGVGPATLRNALAADRPAAAWRTLCASQGATERDVLRVWQLHAERGIGVLLADDDAYPERLRRDPHAPAVLFCVGDPLALRAPATVALVGTRAPTRYGIGVAAQFGADLAAAGVSVVSGLALGIDGAAHEGACGAGAPPVGVVAGGLDKPYPARHARLWQRVAECGAVVSESPAGVRTERWRFPVRNRLLAALSDVVIVVESRHHGGAATPSKRPRPWAFRWVPSPGRSAAPRPRAPMRCWPTEPFRSARRPTSSWPSRWAVCRPRHAGPTRPPRRPRRGIGPAREDRAIYEAFSSDPASLDDLAADRPRPVRPLRGLERLAQAGRAYDHGGWWERA